MIISSIYKKYPIPNILQMHMLRAASVGALICDNWNFEENIDKDSVVQALLIHDTGNIIKFNLDASTMLTDQEKKNLNFWKTQQKIYKQKFNNDDHKATQQIAREIKVSDKVLYLLGNSGSSKLQQVIDSKDYNLAIVTYADLRCAPYNIVSVNERFDDVIKRYKDSDHPLSALEEVEKRRNLGIELENILQQFVKINLNEILDESIKPYLEKITGYNIPTT